MTRTTALLFTYDDDDGEPERQWVFMKYNQDGRLELVYEENIYFDTSFKVCREIIARYNLERFLE